MSLRCRTPNATVRFLCNSDETIFFPEYHYPPEEVETPRIVAPIRGYVAILIPGERRIRRIPPPPVYN